MYFLTRKHYFSFWDPFANHTHDIESSLTPKH